MATYPINTRVLDRDITNAVMEEADITLQSLYELYIPAGTLDPSSRLRIKATLSRVVGTPLPDSDVTCIKCSEGGRAVPQELLEDRILTPKKGMVSVQGSFSYVGESNGKHEIYEAIYDFTEAFGDTFDQDRNLKLYRIRRNDFKKVTKVLTTTFGDLDISDAHLMHGIADEPTYAFGAIVSISSNAPDNFYLYYIEDKTQVSVPSLGQFVLPFYAVADRQIFLAERNTGYIRKFNSAGGHIASNLTLSGLYGSPCAMHAKGSLWVLTFSGNVVELDIDSLTVQAVYATGLTQLRAMWVESPKCIYISYGAAGVLSISALNTENGIVTEIDSAIILSLPIGLGDFNVLHFKALEDDVGYFYTASCATFSGTGLNPIMRIGPVDCP